VNGPDARDPELELQELQFQLPGAGHALFTARRHGNMSSVAGSGREHGQDARERLRTRLGLRCLARGYQVHGASVPRIRAERDLRPPLTPDAQPPVHADGHAASIARVGVMALAADCLPVALGAENAVAMIHAGWRGLAAGVLEEGVRALSELNCGQADIVAIVGPGAGPCCYEVGREVHAALDPGATGRPGAAGPPSLVSPPRRVGPPAKAARMGAAPIDLKAIAGARLLAAGVAQVHDVGVCTICDERFYSHRREGSRAGRQAGVAWLDPSI
jgi:purine-nucleoside/S-methyl-5'-thioadenosine phosphorylase / adenosine deaminase